MRRDYRHCRYDGMLADAHGRIARRTPAFNRDDRAGDLNKSAGFSLAAKYRGMSVRKTFTVAVSSRRRHGSDGVRSWVL